MTAAHASALLAGATGLVGHALAAQIHSQPGAPMLHALVRRTGSAPAGCQEIVVDFNRLPALPAAATAFCALGTTIAQAGSQAAFRAVDFDAVLHFAHAAKAAGVTRFAVVSALGADARSASFYNRVKGEMEAAVAGLGFACVVIARPSLLTGNRAALGQPLRLAERAAIAVTGPLRGFIPARWRPIEADTVARALIVALQQEQPAGVRLVESAELQTLGADAGHGRG